MRRERELFVTLMASPESAALRHIFQAERAAARIAGVPETTPARVVNKVGVIGAGTMGGGITMALINAGLPVVLLETTQEALDRGLATITEELPGSDCARASSPRRRWRSAWRSSARRSTTSRCTMWIWSSRRYSRTSRSSARCS